MTKWEGKALHPVIQAMVNQRINQVQPDELYQHAVQFNIPISKNQASRIARRVHGKNIDLFHPSGQQKLSHILTEEIGPDLASKLEQRFKELIKKY